MRKKLYLKVIKGEALMQWINVLQFLEFIPRTIGESFMFLFTLVVYLNPKRNKVLMETQTMFTTSSRDNVS